MLIWYLNIHRSALCFHKDMLFKVFSSNTVCLVGVLKVIKSCKHHWTEQVFPHSGEQRIIALLVLEYKTDENHRNLLGCCTEKHELF